MALLVFSRQADGLDPSAGAPPVVPSLGETYGAYLLGTYGGLILYGLAIQQAYRYWVLFPTDSLFIRLLVVIVMILETVHTVFTMHSCYHYLVTNYSNPSALELGVWSVNVIPILLAATMFISQLFFARRVYLMGNQYRIIVGIAMLLFAVEFGFAIAAVVEVVKIATFESIKQVNHLLTAVFTGAFLGDSLLTMSLFSVIFRNRHERNDSIWDTLMLYLINTGLLHDVLNVVSLVVVIVLPHGLIHGSVAIVTTRLYGNTLLAVLNSREFNVTRGIEVIDGMDLGMNIIARANRLAAQEQWNVPQVPEPSPPAINIKVTTEMGGDGDKQLEKGMTDARVGSRRATYNFPSFMVLDDR